MSLFSAQGLVKRFGGLLATDHVDLAVEGGGPEAGLGVRVVAVEGDGEAHGASVRGRC